MITKNDTLLSKTLIDRNLLNSKSLEPYLEELARSKDSLFGMLLKRGVLSEEQLLSSLSEALRLGRVGLAEMKADPELLEKVPLKIAEYYKMVPLKLEKRRLTIAVSSPLDLRTQDDIRAHLGYEIEMALAKEKDIAEALKRFYGFAAGTIGEMIAQAPSPAQQAAALAEPAFEKIENIEKLAGDASIAKLVNQIILEAYKRRATDIHIEPYRGKVKLRYRIDGVVYNANVSPEINRFILPILSRIKIMAGLNIVEKRLPQDGRAIVKVEDTQLDLRVSCIPTSYGESVVIRMLPMNRIFDLAKLGLNEEHLEIFENLIEKPHGIIFITGPTGSGKSTTLYACLNRINTDERKIITIEDPVEYEMEGVTQIQISPVIGLDFARGLRSMLRHDPDVMMVGEVRDLETAEIAIRVALTGHLVFSTLHTNDAASAITRLADIGVAPYLIASSVEAFIAQRLVRMICPHCKAEDKSVGPEIKKQIAKELGLRGDTFPVYAGKGCDRCNQTGFWGRVAIHEVLLMKENIKPLVMRKAPSGEIKRKAIANGMRTLRQDGWQKVVKGVTTPGEIFEIAEAEPELEAMPAQELPPAPLTASRASDRRIFQRLDGRLSICYKIVKMPPVAEASFKKKANFQDCTVTLNLGAGGLVFVADENMPVGAILEFRIDIPDGGELIDCLARVVRQEECEGESKYEVAVCFLDLSTPLRTRIAQFVEKGLKE